MATRNVVLTDHQAQLVEQLVTSGRYQNVSEVLRAGLRMVEETETIYESKLKALREAVSTGIADIEAGRFTTFTGEEFFDYLDERIERVLQERRQKLDSGTAELTTFEALRARGRR
jgi:antitoxin ParD1/3/4